eukprot:XP_011603862.1 PREDICTED: uncharacterized protein LOC105416677 isoform X2 [Takifugu rubripes]
MQSPRQSNSQPSPVTTATTEKELDSESAHKEPDAQQEEIKSPSAAETEAAVAQHGGGTLPETHGGVAGTQTASKCDGRPPTQPSDQTDKEELGSDLKPSATIEDKYADGRDGPTVENQAKRDRRKYVPSKKAMVDPLKMDMSKPAGIPLTTSQLSLQCIECHIIFSDHKSKERHLKASHPAEYEQCILRNALFACYVCDRHFTNSTELMAHQKAHVEKKPFKCPICGQAFNKSSELTSHKKSHFGSDGYACTDCGKLCKTMTLLKYHRRTHTGEKPYICKECGQRFTMPKTLQKHVMSHLEGAEENGENSKAKLKNTDGVVIKYLCFLCNATFKTTKTRLHHMKTKHNMVPARTSKAIHTGQQFKESTPIITPISISEPALLQVEPNGPLQKVDANIDTEQICRLIESLGNVQKVNQVVILGQVPPHAAPLEVQQISQLAEPVHLNPPQMDVVGLKLPESKTDELDLSNNTCDPMEQTIILEPITPDGQLLNPPFAEVGCSITAGGNIGLNNSEPLANSCDPMEQTIILEPITPDGQLENCFPGEVPGELPFADSEQTERGVVPQILEQTGTGANQPDRFPDNLDQTVILELTPAVIPSEQSHTEPQHDIPLSVFVASSEPEKIPAERTGPSSPSRPHTVELEQQQPPTCSSAAQTQDEHDADPKEGTESQLQKVKPDHIQPSQDGARSQEKNDQEAVKKVSTEQVEDLPKSEEPSAKESLVAQVETKEASQVLLNTMSAQELVKVRKRKPSRAYFFQEYMQELVGSIYKDDLQIKAKPAKRQRTEKAHLVVKFGPPSKEKKNREKKSPQQRKRSQGDAIMGNTSTANLSGKKGASQKRGRKGKGNKNTRHLVSTPKKKSSPPSHDSQQIKDVRKNKMKRQKEVVAEGATHIEERAPVESPKFKKTKKAKIMQKVPPKSAKEGKRKKKRAEETEDMRTASADVTQDALRLLKGHKQPQLRVYKLDTSKASGHALEASAQQSQTSAQHSPGARMDHSAADSRKDVSAEGKKMGGRRKKNQKALSLLSSLKVPRPPPETLPSKTKTTRKRKASSKVEMEGVITSSSNRALECHDCGERFSEVASLQKHKGTVHVLESPGLTYTNGNIFEGVTSSDFYNLPKRDRMVIGVMNTATGWDTEPELGEAALEDREPGVSFPALIPSPSLPVPPSDVAMMDEDKGASKLGATVRPPSDQNCETTQSSGNDDPTMAVGNKRVAEEGVCDTADEDVKEDLMLEVDLVTVGEQSEKDDLPSPVVPGGQTKATRTCDGGRKSATPVSDESEKSVSLQTCSAHQMEIKEEEEEICGQSKKVARHGELNRDGLKGGGTGHRTVAASTKGGAVDATQSEKEEQECEVVYEQHTIASDSEMNDENEAAIKNSELGPVAEVEANKSSASLPPVPAALEESREEPVVLGLKPRNTSVEEALNERGDDHGREQSPAVMLEELPTSRQARTSKDQSPMTTKSKPRQVSSGVTEKGVRIVNLEIKVEENMSEAQLAAASVLKSQDVVLHPQHPRDINAVLVKEERTLVLHEVQAAPGSRRMRWNVEPVSVENTSSPFVEHVDLGQDCPLTPDFHTSTCIFYPVKEEEREVLLGPSHTSSRTEKSINLLQTEHCATSDERSCFAEDYQTTARGPLPEPGPIGIAEEDAAVTMWPQPPELQDFLVQSSDEEDVGCLELSDPQLDSEAEAMAYFKKNQTEPAKLSSSQQQTPSAETTTREPIDFFSVYFGQETWEEIANCTVKISNIPKPVTAREVAQFVGIHIAMGTLKFPSPKLYWEELTKVPLVAEAMPLLRFLELSRILKLAYPPPEVQCDARSESDLHNVQHKTLLTGKKTLSHHKAGQLQRDPGNDLNCSKTQTDPLWKVQPLLRRFKAGCGSLRQDGDFAVDQYPLPLTGKTHKKPSLCCTTLVGFGGFLLHLDIKLGSSSKEDAVEKMVPSGSTVFLCKQELSTPAMLERLLLAGVHGAGRVGGARGQIGDEFVSSDGKLMLRRSDCGFILSTVGSSQRDVASLTDDFEKAQMSAHLNRDLQSLYTTPLTASAPACWPQAVLWYLTDLALINSWLLYREGHTVTSAPLSLMAFRLEVSKALILSSGSDALDSVPSQPLTESTRATREKSNPDLVEESPLPDVTTRYDGLEHWPEQLGEGEGGRCRFRDCQRTSRVLCLKCCVFLCISRSSNCFLKFHNQESLGKG